MANINAVIAPSGTQYADAKNSNARALPESTTDPEVTPAEPLDVWAIVD